MLQVSLAVINVPVREILGRVSYNLAFQTSVFHAYLRIVGGRETHAQTVSTVKLVRYKPPFRVNCT